jgi:sulfite exporter TauE/SafE
MEITTTTGALLAGLITSLHCAGMCGPMACGVGTLAKTEAERMTAATLYHGGRLFSYGLIGALCGSLGTQPLRWFFDSPAVLLPWALVIALLLSAFGLDKKIPRPAILHRFTARARFRTQGFSGVGAAGLMGLLTPLLPCGPLYLVFGVALLAGSPAKGAEFTLAFGLGTVPLLWLAQHSFHRFRTRMKPITMQRLQRGLAITAALMMAWRLHDTLPYNVFPQQEKPADALPSCCHGE